MKPHPAKYTKSLLKPMAEMLVGCKSVLDPFGGVGGIFQLKPMLPTTHIVCCEIEPEWAAEYSQIIRGDFFKLYLGRFEAVCTSPTYGNRMADSFNAKDNSRRNTYHHALGRRPSAGSSATMQFGKEYKDFHKKAWQRVWDILEPNGRFVLNIKDHIRSGKLVAVTDWHIETIQSIGFQKFSHVKVKTPSNRFGANGALRVEHESVIGFLKPKE